MAAATSKAMFTRVFHPSRHLWLETVSQTASHRWIKIGLTERGLQEVGDVTKLVFHSDTKVATGQELLQIHFEGHSITSADELYHTVWDTFSDQVNIESPLAGSLITDDNNDLMTPGEFIDEDTVLVSLKVDEEEFQRQCMENTLVKEPQYLKAIQSMEPGKFAD